MSKSSYNIRTKVFLTQDETMNSETMISKHSSELNNQRQELSNLKKITDALKLENIKKNKYLDTLNIKIIELKKAAESINNDWKTQNDRFKEIQVDIEKASKLLDQEIEMKKIYDHMLYRKKKEGTRLDIRVNKFSKDLKEAQLQMDIEKEKARKSKDKKFSIKTTLAELKESLENDTKKYSTHISRIENSIATRKELLNRYDKRVKRQAEVIELAARHDREVHEKDVRRRITANILLYGLLEEKELMDKKAGKEIASAFQDIKVKTGLTVPNDILFKFMSREETNSKLISEVEKAETNLDNARKEYDKLKDKLKVLSLINDKNENVFGHHGDEIIENAYSNLEKIKTQERKATNVYREITEWGKKICKKLKIDTSDNFEIAIKRISERINVLEDGAKLEKEEFDKNLRQFNSKKTNDLLKEIYKDLTIPKKAQIIS